MMVGGEDERKTYFQDRKINLSEVTVKYERLVVFIRHDFAEIWGFRYGLTYEIGTIKIMANTGVFVRVIFDRKRSISSDTKNSSTILT